MNTSSNRGDADATTPGLGALLAGFVTIGLPFVVHPTTSSSAFRVFVAGTAVGIVVIWLTVRALKTPKGSPGRGAAVAGLVLAILGVSFSAFLALVSSIVENDTIL